MEKFFLRRFLAVDELNIIDHQQINRPEAFLERNRILESKRPNKMIHELFGRQINHPAFGEFLARVMGDRMHQMRFAEPDAAIQKERVERRRFRIGDPPGRGVGKFIGLTDNKVFKNKPRIKRRADAGNIRCRSGFGFLEDRGRRRRRLVPHSAYLTHDRLGPRRLDEYFEISYCWIFRHP